MAIHEDMITTVYLAIAKANIDGISKSDHPHTLMRRVSKKNNIDCGEFTMCVDALIRVGLVYVRRIQETGEPLALIANRIEYPSNML